MTCRQINTLLEAYSDGELSSREADRVRMHLEQCPVCREEDRLNRITRDFLNRAPAASPPEYYWKEVTDLVLARTIEADRKLDSNNSRQQRDPRTSFTVPLVSVGLSMLLLFTALFMGSDRGKIAVRPDTQIETRAVSTAGGWLADISNNSLVSTQEQSQLTRAAMLLGPPGPLRHFDILTDLMSQR